MINLSDNNAAFPHHHMLMKPQRAALPRTWDLALSKTQGTQLKRPGGQGGVATLMPASSCRQLGPTAECPWAGLPFSWASVDKQVERARCRNRRVQPPTVVVLLYVASVHLTSPPLPFSGSLGRGKDCPTAGLHSLFTVRGRHSLQGCDCSYLRE